MPGPDSGKEGPGQGRLAPPLLRLLPTWAAGSSLEGDILHLGPQDMAALSSEPQASLSVPAALAWGPHQI